MDEGAEAVVAAYEDAAVGAVVDSVAGFEHRAPAREGAVVAYEGELRTAVTGSVGIETGHLAGILLALQERENIFSGRNHRLSVFEGITNSCSVNR